MFLAWRKDLSRLGGELPALDWLLNGAAGISRAHLQTLLLDPNGQVDLRCPRLEVERLWRTHLSESVPLQYLVGRCCWRDFDLAVGPAVLIPRPETECMIDLAVEMLDRQARKAHPARGTSISPLWADLGTGSGCLALGLAQAFPKSQGLAVDISPEALMQAQRNLEEAGLTRRVRLIQGHWFTAVQPWWGQLQLVLANPPYIPSKEVELLDPVVRDYEPRLALDGGVDGLCAMRLLIKDAPKALKSGGVLLIEHHHDQSDQMLKLLGSHGLVDGQSHQDLEGHRRFVSARRP